MEIQLVIDTFKNSSSLYTYKHNEILKSVQESSVWSSSFIHRDLLIKLFKIKN